MRPPDPPKLEVQADQASDVCRAYFIAAVSINVFLHPPYTQTCSIQNAPRLPQSRARAGISLPAKHAQPERSLPLGIRLLCPVHRRDNPLDARTARHCRIIPWFCFLADRSCPGTFCRLTARYVSAISTRRRFPVQHQIWHSICAEER